MAVTTGRPRPMSRPYDELYLSGIQQYGIRMENLAANGDVTERVFWRAKFPIQILEAEVLPEAAATGVDGSNTVLVTLRNITQQVDIATVTSTTNWAANTPVALALTAANTDVAADDVIGIVVTQGTAADVAIFWLQITFRPYTAF